MIKFERIQLIDDDGNTFVLDYDTDSETICIEIEGSSYFSVPVSEWDDFIQKLQQAKKLITPTTDNENQNQ